MRAKLSEKARAINLRKQGKTYSEILKEVKVAKSTLSLWLRDVGLAKKQEQRITQKRINAQKRGAKSRHVQRVELTNQIYQKSEGEIGKLSRRELWFMGVMLYWAEGSKEKEWRPGSGVQFANSDPAMIQLFLYWLREICKVSKESIKLSLYIHSNHKNRVEVVKDFWLKTTGHYPKYTYFKKHNPKTKRKNVGKDYYGVVVVTVQASSSLNRQITGWTRGIVKNYCRVVQW